jgi:hypothetical protein
VSNRQNFTTQSSALNRSRPTTQYFRPRPTTSGYQYPLKCFATAIGSHACHHPHTLQTRQSPYTKQRCATPNKMHSSTARLMTCSERTRPGMPEIASGQSTAKPCQRCERPFHECSTIKRCSAAMARTHRTRAASPGSKRRTAMARRTSPPSRHMLVK